MLNYNCSEISMDEPLRDYLYYEKISGSKYNRRCIDGHITGCGNCVAYCRYVGHSGFLTKEQRKEHNCIGNGCFYYLPKIKRENPQRYIGKRTCEIVDIASNVISELEGIKIIDADRNQSGEWFLKYISITNGYSIETIENKISAFVGETITMVNLNFDFDRAVQIIFA